MTQQYDQKDGEGAAFYQTNKKNERSPDWTGKFTWQGQELELAMWERKSKTNNTPYIRFVIKERFVPHRPANNPPPREQPQAAPEFDDSIPF